MPGFLLHVMNRMGDVEVMTSHYLEAPSYQHVKYWYHKVQKSCGYSNPSWADDKHVLEGPHGLVTDIEGIEKLNYVEEPVIKRHLPKWPKEAAE